MAFLVGHDEGAIWVEADAVGGAEAGGEDVGLVTIGRDAEKSAVMGDERVLGVAGGLGVVEVALVVGLQAHCEFVEVLGDLVVVVEAFDVVDRFVAVGVVELGELVAAGDEDFVIHDLESKRLEETGADAFPGEGAFELIDAFDDPDVAHPSANGGAFAIGIEVKSAGAHPRLVRVEVGDGDGESVDCEGAGLIAALNFRGDDGRERFWRGFRNDGIEGDGFKEDAPVRVNHHRDDLRAFRRLDFEAKSPICDYEILAGRRTIMRSESEGEFLLAGSDPECSSKSAFGSHRHVFLNLGISDLVG